MFRDEVAKAQKGQFRVAKPKDPIPAKPKQYPRDFTDRELLEDLWTTVQALKGPSS